MLGPMSRVIFARLHLALDSYQVQETNKLSTGYAFTTAMLNQMYRLSSFVLLQNLTLLRYLLVLWMIQSAFLKCRREISRP